MTETHDTSALDIEAEVDAEIEREAAAMTNALAHALAGLRRCDGHVARLIDLYHVEYVEGAAYDVIAHLETATRALRAARALHRDAEHAIGRVEQR